MCMCVCLCVWEWQVWECDVDRRTAIAARTCVSPATDSDTGVGPARVPAASAQSGVSQDSDGVVKDFDATPARLKLIGALPPPPLPLSPPTNTGVLSPYPLK